VGGRAAGARWGAHKGPVWFSPCSSAGGKRWRGSSLWGDGGCGRGGPRGGLAKQNGPAGAAVPGGGACFACSPGTDVAEGGARVGGLWHQPGFLATSGAAAKPWRSKKWASGPMWVGIRGGEAGKGGRPPCSAGFSVPGHYTRIGALGLGRVRRSRFFSLVSGPPQVLGSSGRWGRGARRRGPAGFRG